MRIAGKDLEHNKAIGFALCRIYGIGLTRAKYILQELSIDYTLKVKDLNQEQLTNINDFIEKKFVVENDLKRERNLNKKKKIDINCYVGVRLRKGLPCRGQRTNTNSKTARRVR